MFLFTNLFSPSFLDHSHVGIFSYSAALIELYVWVCAPSFIQCQENTVVVSVALIVMTVVT